MQNLLDRRSQTADMSDAQRSQFYKELKKRRDDAYRELLAQLLDRRGLGANASPVLIGAL